MLDQSLHVNISLEESEVVSPLLVPPGVQTDQVDLAGREKEARDESPVGLEAA